MKQLLKRSVESQGSIYISAQLKIILETES
jgi:hypothetical protein